MYDDLVARLRNAAQWADQGLVITPSICLQAADAIEELSVVVRAQKAVLDKFPRWIPVAERLPDMNVPCLVYNRSQPTMVGWRIDYKRFRIPGSCLPDPPTHWMPLPQPPKEEDHVYSG